MATILNSLSFIILGYSHVLLLTLLAVLFVGFGNEIQEIASITYIQNIKIENIDIVEIFSISQSFVSICIINTMTISPILIKALGIAKTIYFLGIIPEIISICMVLN